MRRFVSSIISNVVFTGQLERDEDELKMETDEGLTAVEFDTIIANPIAQYENLCLFEG